MSMSSATDMGAMDMGSDHTASKTGEGVSISGMPGHSMSMSRQMDMSTERFAQVTKPELGTSAMPDHSKTVSSCSHEACGQISVSASPPSAGHFQPNSLHWPAINIAISARLLTGVHLIGPRTQPPKIPAVDRLVTTLRI